MINESLIGIIKDALSSFECTQKRGHYPADHWSNRAHAVIKGDASTREDEAVGVAATERAEIRAQSPNSCEISVKKLVDETEKYGLYHGDRLKHVLRYLGVVYVD